MAGAYASDMDFFTPSRDPRQQWQHLIATSGDKSDSAMFAGVESRAIFVGGPAFSFGPFRLLPCQRLLLEGSVVVRIGSRAFDILTVLVEQAGTVVGKEELMARVWPKVFVDATNLKTNISVLRRALGEGHDGKRYIVTVPGRGYNFVAPVRVSVQS